MIEGRTHVMVRDMERRLRRGTSVRKNTSSAPAERDAFTQRQRPTQLRARHRDKEVCTQQESLPLSLTHRKAKIKRQTRHIETHSKTDREAHTQTHKYRDIAAHRDTGSGTHRKRHVLIGRQRSRNRGREGEREADTEAQRAHIHE